MSAPTTYGRALCPWCGQVRACYTPRDGDGSRQLYRKHNDTNGRPCEGWARTVAPENER